MSKSFEAAAWAYATLLMEISDLTREISEHPCERAHLQIGSDETVNYTPPCWMRDQTKYHDDDVWMGAVPLEDRCDACKLAYPLVIKRSVLHRRKGALAKTFVAARRNKKRPPQVR